MRFHLGALWPEWGCLFSHVRWLFHQISHLLELFPLNVPKSSYMFVNRHSKINWSPKEGKEWFWKMKICAICGNLQELNFFSNIWVVGIPRQWIFSPRFWEWFVLSNVIACGLGKKNLEFAIWWKITWFLGAFFSCLREGCWCPFFWPSWEPYIVFWWLLLVPNVW